MREKLETLPLSELRELAKAQGLKGVSGFRKSELIDILCKEAEKTEDKTGGEDRRRFFEPGSSGTGQRGRGKGNSGSDVRRFWVYTV